MLRPELSVRILTFAVVSACCFGQQLPSTISEPAVQATSPSWEESLWNLPVLRFFEHLFQPTATQPSGIAGAAEVSGAASPCPVKPLDPIVDPAALQLESMSGSANVVDVSDMVPAAASALLRFQTRVESIGGSMVLKSAYRPAAYQQHLANVWYKWMDELRNNTDPACQPLRARVQAEFTGHHLIETQHPVAVSDHTRGLAFDATVELPKLAKVGRRRVTLDSLARLAGLLRPAILADPVHFKFIGGRLPATRVARLSHLTRRRSV